MKFSVTIVVYCVIHITLFFNCAPKKSVTGYYESKSPSYFELLKLKVTRGVRYYNLGLNIHLHADSTYIGFTQKRKTPLKSSLSGCLYIFICMPYNKIL
jgi:hypothetical protein